MMTRMMLFWACCMLCLGTVRGQQRHADGPDDVLQHVPLASVVVLKAAGADRLPARSGAQVEPNSWASTLGAAVASYAVAASVTYGLKHTVSERRPDHTDQRSFPSGHATLAFAGATALRHEYGHLSPWVGAGGYAVAALTAADRVRRDRHHWHDVCAGAAIGGLSAELVYYVKGKLKKADCVAVGFSPNSLSLALSW